MMRRRGARAGGRWKAGRGRRGGTVRDEHVAGVVVVLAPVVKGWTLEAELARAAAVHIEAHRAARLEQAVVNGAVRERREVHRAARRAHARLRELGWEREFHRVRRRLGLVIRLAVLHCARVVDEGRVCGEVRPGLLQRVHLPFLRRRHRLDLVARLWAAREAGLRPVGRGSILLRYPDAHLRVRAARAAKRHAGRRVPTCPAHAASWRA